MTGLLGGAFDPPHNGHVELARAANEEFEFDEFVILVTEQPGHKDAAADADTRLRLARAAFPDYELELDPHSRTIDMLRAARWRDPLFLIGADEFSDFLDWKEPNAVLEHVRLAVATRPGYPRARLDAVLAKLDHPDRVLFFEIESLPISSREVRERVARGEPIDDLVPAGVAELIAELGLYRG
jgi:nicotinate-nucleotide adenylyltransferase